MNDQQRAAMQMALEALERVLPQYEALLNDCDLKSVSTVEQVREAITALREALAQPQCEWVDLTDDEIANALNGATDSCDLFRGIREVIAKLKAKNTPPSVEAMRIETLEKAAKVCESYIVEGIGREMAAAIRSMK